MLSAVVTALLLVVMLLIITSLIISAWREYRGHKRMLAVQSSTTLPAHPLDRHVTAVLHLHEGSIVSVEELKPVPAFTLSSSWYKRRRTLVSIGFLVMVLLTFFVQDSVTGGTLQGLTRGLGFSFLRYAQPFDMQTSAHSAPLTASIRLQRVDSASPAQYHNSYQLNVWSYSSCSGIAMEMVMNAYGRHLIAADVLQEEQDLGVWNTQLGLLREDGIAMTAAHFGFDTSANHTRTLQEIIAIANKGAPVIVSVRDRVYYPGGHLFVIRGGDSQYVYMADSSLNNFKRMTYPMFMGMWQTFNAVLTPQA